MRKADREIKTLDDIIDVIERCDTIRIGISDKAAPYIVPVSFGYEVLDGKLAVYFHGAKEGRKAELLRALPRVSVEADLCHGFPSNGRGGYTCDYESVMGSGFVELLDGEEAVKALEAGGIDLQGLEQGDVVLAFAVLLAKGLRQQGHAMCRHIRCHRLQRALQVQADDVARIIGARGRAAYFGHCRLEAAHNAACRVEQRSIPVENDEGVALGRKCGDRMVR